MSGQATKAATGDLARAHIRPIGGHIDPHSDQLRRRATAAARRVRDLSLARGNGDEFGRERLGTAVYDYRDIQDRERFNAILFRAYLDDDAFDRAMAFSVSLIPDSFTVESSGVDFVRSRFVRVLDAIAYPPPGVTRGMPPLGVVVVLSICFLLINPGDWIGEIKGALAVLVPVLLYWWKQKRDERDKEKAEAHETADSILRFSSEKEKRLEERDSLLRAEEREFMHRQMELSRRRGHILARGYMSVELANDKLIELLRKNNIQVPEALLVYQTRAMILTELKELETETVDLKQDSPRGE